MTYIRVNFSSYVLPLSESTVIIPEHTKVLTPKGVSLVLGALCYRQSRNAGNHCYIIPDTLIQARIAWVRKLIYLLSDYIKYDSRKEISVAAIFRAFAQYIRWCDSEGLHDVLTGDKTKDYEAYRLFSLQLSEKVKNHQIKSSHAKGRQSHVKEIYSEIFEDPQFYEGVPNIPSINDSEPTETPCEDRQAKTLSFCMSIFQGISDFILNARPYPFFIKIPNYLGFKDNGFWMTHSNHWFDLGHVYSSNRIFYPIDYESGKVRTAQELSELTGGSLFLCRLRIRSSELNRQKLNINTRCTSRLDKARLAMSAFYILFIANTGINNAQATALEWNDDYTEERGKVGFKTIKYRASGKIVHFEIQSNFTTHFKKYLKLREYINKDSSVNLLFGYKGKSRLTSPNIKNLIRVVNKLDPTLDFVMPKEWRAAKSDWYIRNYDPSIAAQALQNTEHTILKNYATGSHVKHANELSNFFDALSNLEININDDSKHKVSSVGHCINPMYPKALINLKAIEPDCKQPEGCLFCDKFVIHSDEKDIRKLFSCLFCIEQTAHLSASIDDYENIFGVVRRRIEMIVNEVAYLSNEHAKMISKIKREVMEEEKLDPYWEVKLSMLIEIGVA